MITDALRESILLSLLAVNFFIIARLAPAPQMQTLKQTVWYVYAVYALATGIYLYTNSALPYPISDGTIIGAAMLSFVVAIATQYGARRSPTSRERWGIASALLALFAGAYLVYAYGAIHMFRVYALFGMCASLVYLCTAFILLKKKTFIAVGMVFTAGASVAIGILLSVFLLIAESHSMIGPLYAIACALLVSAGSNAAGVYDFPLAPTYDYFDAIERLSKTLNHNLDLSQLFEQIASTMRDLFGTSHMQLVLFSTNAAFSSQPTHSAIRYPEAVRQFFEKEHHGVVADEIAHLLAETDNPKTKRNIALAQLLAIAREYDIALLAPIYLHNKLIAVFGFGHKENGLRYHTKDLSVIRTFVNHAATAVHKAELYEQVKDYSKTLERKVAERTEALRIAHEDQKKLMLAISHNVQTPLTVFKAELHALQHQLPAHHIAAALETAVDDLSDFAYRLLSLAKLEQSHERFNLVKLNITELITDVCEYVRTIAQEKNITLEAEIEQNVHVRSDCKQLRDAMINLLSNAIKYIANEKRITVTLTTTKSAALLSVADTGIGIPQKDMAHVFDRFYRAEGNAHASSGTGLGLAITKNIIEKHGGAISVASALGKGTTFSVRLPLA